ncbi:zinc finger protein 316-like isoform X2 [Phymastichus coffea]|uniref:zinc finger protein 316-like isoform X2 n=1 Tax=Phymastichus coffea TaxID=108790 RepID=UPI00273BABDE|nr:zinc finger protein 316-like isoform X2 [Phymastichus coffea]
MLLIRLILCHRSKLPSLSAIYSRLGCFSRGRESNEPASSTRTRRGRDGSAHQPTDEVCVCGRGWRKMEYGAREADGETAVEASNEEESGGRSSSCGSSSASEADWPLDGGLGLASLQLQQSLPGSAALLLNSLYSLHALHSQRLWRDARASDDEPAEPRQDNEVGTAPPAVARFPDHHSRLCVQKEEETAAAAELPALNSWMLSAYASMLGRLSAVAAGAAALGPDSDTESRSSRRSSAPATDSRSRESSPRCSSPAAKRKRPAGKRARQKRAAEQQASTSRPADGESAAAAAAATTSSAAGPAGRRRGLQALQRVRYEREEYRCGLCPYACTIEKAFERHLRAHARGTAHESRVSCAVCGADRSSELDLSQHMRRHRDNRYFCCDICIFRTVQLKKLIQHRRMHTGEKPHLCPHCSYRSARRDNLRSHVRRVHKKENLYQDTFSPRAPSFLGTEQPAEPEPGPGFEPGPARSSD